MWTSSVRTATKAGAIFLSALWPGRNVEKKTGFRRQNCRAVSRARVRRFDRIVRRSSAAVERLPTINDYVVTSAIIFRLRVSPFMAIISHRVVALEIRTSIILFESSPSSSVWCGHCRADTRKRDKCQRHMQRRRVYDDIKHYADHLSHYVLYGSWRLRALRCVSVTCAFLQPPFKLN